MLSQCSHAHPRAQSECIKLLLSGAALLRSMRLDPRGTVVTTDWRTAALFPIPSIIYVVHNNMQFHTMARCLPRSRSAAEAPARRGCP